MSDVRHLKSYLTNSLPFVNLRHIDIEESSRNTKVFNYYCIANFEKLDMKILMVCLGNICRSPMAEGIMRKKLESHGLDHQVDSCGTANYHVGEHPDPRAIAKAKKYGIDISSLIGRQLKADDFDKFDLIYAMDASNYTNIMRVVRSLNDKKKVKLILEELDSKQKKDVPDPYYGGDEGFEKMYELLDKACEEICTKLKYNLLIR